MPERYIARSKAIAARTVGGEMMVMSAVDSTFFTLNEVASTIWRAADGRTPLAEIVTGKVCQEFDVDPEQVLRLKGFHRPIISHRVRGLRAQSGVEAPGDPRPDGATRAGT